MRPLYHKVCERERGTGELEDRVSLCCEATGLCVGDAGQEQQLTHTQLTKDGIHALSLYRSTVPLQTHTFSRADSDQLQLSSLLFCRAPVSWRLQHGSLFRAPRCSHFPSADFMWQVHSSGRSRVWAFFLLKRMNQLRAAVLWGTSTHASSFFFFFFF